MQQGKYENSDMIFVKDENNVGQNSRKRRHFILGDGGSSDESPGDFFDQQHEKTPLKTRNFTMRKVTPGMQKKFMTSKNISTQF